jgi:hypothetical protein
MKKRKVKKEKVGGSKQNIEMRYLKLLTELKEIDRMGTSEHFNTLMKYFDAVRWYMHNEKNEENKRSFFKILCDLYKSDGNRHRSGFLEFYQYISKFNYFDSNNSFVLLFRAMTNAEFRKLQIINTNTNPSWSSQIQNTERFAISQILMKEAKKSVAVAALFRKEDIIYHFEADEDESEFFVKNDANPIFFSRLFDFEKSYVQKRTAINVEEIEITPTECRNSYGIFSTLSKKGFEDISNDEIREMFLKISNRRIVNQFVNFIKYAA